ncbi:MAG: YdeI/OmpD-associated family protein [bacterium]
MSNKNLSGGLVHKIPVDLEISLTKNDKASALWNGISQIARNEFLCWVENAKQQKTRDRRIKRTIEELLEGQKRPCCWVGCIHRTDKKPSTKLAF